MVVLPVDANGNPLIWFIVSIPLEDFCHVYQALLFSSLPSRNHQDFSATYQAKVTLPVPLYSMIIMNVPPKSNQSMVVAPYSDTNIFLLILGGASYPLRFFLYIDFNHHFLFTNCSIYSINFLQLWPWIYPCLVRLRLAMTKFNKIIIPVLNYRTYHAPLPPSNHHP